MRAPDKGALRLCSQDLWMFPSVLMLHPEAAKALLQYRIRTLSGALYNAQNLGYQVRGTEHLPYGAPQRADVPYYPPAPSVGGAGMSWIPREALWHPPACPVHVGTTA